MDSGVVQMGREELGVFAHCAGAAFSSAAPAPAHSGSRTEAAREPRTRKAAGALALFVAVGALGLSHVGNSGY